MSALEKLRVKAAFFDKPSGRTFDNLTPVSTWVEQNNTVAELLPLLAKRFWSVVVTEVLDDDGDTEPQVPPPPCPPF
jgi:hypothetical protein